jgi:hypothetical protein
VLAVNHELAALGVDIALELAVRGIVLEHVNPVYQPSTPKVQIAGSVRWGVKVHVFEVDEGIVDGLDGNLLVEQGISKHLGKSCQRTQRHDKSGNLTIRPIRPNPLMPTLMTMLLMRG